MKWEQVTNVTPVVNDGGIAVPALNPFDFKVLLKNIDDAMARVNQQEAARVSGLPPEPKEVFIEWFDETRPKGA